MPDIEAALGARQAAGSVRRPRLDVLFAGGIGLVAMAGLVVYPHASADEARISAEPASPRAEATASAVSIPALSAVRESAVTAPPLTLPYVPRAVPSDAKTIAPTPRTSLRPAPVIAVALPSPVAPDASPVADGRGSDPVPEPAPPPPPPPADPMQRLRSALGACERLGGVFERAMCEQGARLAQCDGYWGAVDLCPAGRTDYGQ